MVASITKVVDKANTVAGERCMEVRQALDAGAEHDSIPYSMVVIRRRDENCPTEEEYLRANVRVGDLAVTMHTTGCLSDSYEEKEVPVVVDCPSDQTERCANCILQLAQGESIRKSMEFVTPFIQS